MTKTPLKVRLSQLWQPALWYGLLLAAFGALLWYKLGSLTGGYSASEASTLHASNSLQTIFQHPLNAPFTLLGRGLLFLNDHGLFVMRLTAVIIGLAMISLFYWLLRHWHGERAAIIGTVLFGGSAWFLHTARLGTPDILLFGVLALTSCFIWLRRNRSWLAVLVSFVVLSAFLYVPGMIWLVIIGVAWQWRTIDRIFKENLWAVTIGALLFLAALTPMGLAIYHSPELAKVLAGLPAHGWPQVVDSLKRLLEVPMHVFIRGPQNPERWLGVLPVLDYFSMAMAALGAYLYVKNYKLGRVYLVAGTLLAGTVLTSLGGAVTLTFIVPFLYMLAGVGADFMLQRWLVVFPRNVFAKAVGVCLIGLAIAASCWYSLRHYFVAWPQTPATKNVFVLPEQRVSSDTMKQ